MYKRILNYLYRFIKCAKVRECYQRVAFIYKKKITKRNEITLELTRVHVFKCRLKKKKLKSICTCPSQSGTVSHKHTCLRLFGDTIIRSYKTKIHLSTKPLN